MVVEIAQNPNKKGWKPSGLATTKAKYWVYMFSDDAFIIVEVDRLNRYLDINDQIPVKEFAKFSNNPTKGYLLYPEDVSKLLASEVYDAPSKRNREAPEGQSGQCGGA
jgi:hypothetical protein